MSDYWLKIIAFVAWSAWLYGAGLFIGRRSERARQQPQLGSRDEELDSIARFAERFQKEKTDRTGKVSPTLHRFVWALLRGEHRQ